jgi:hypothetical protein
LPGVSKTGLHPLRAKSPYHLMADMKQPTHDMMQGSADDLVAPQLVIQAYLAGEQLTMPACKDMSAILGAGWDYININREA